MSHTPKLISGVKYQSHCRTPQRVTGWLVQCPNLNGKGGDTLVPVTLLTAEGERYTNVLVRVIDVAGVKVRDFSGFSDHMLWRVADIDMSGCGERALAELAHRQHVELEEAARIERARLDISRRAADLLMGRV